MLRSRGVDIGFLYDNNEVSIEALKLGIIERLDEKELKLPEAELEELKEAIDSFGLEDWLDIRQEVIEPLILLEESDEEGDGLETKAPEKKGSVSFSDKEQAKQFVIKYMVSEISAISRDQESVHEDDQDDTNDEP